MLLFWTLALIAAAAYAQDRDQVPFDEWLTSKNDASIQWSLHSTRASLNENQRLAISIVAEVQAGELRKRPHPLLLVMEIRDRENHTYRSKPAAIFGRRTGPANLPVRMTERVFVVPGHYEVAAALYDPDRNQHNLKRISFNVSGAFGDPLHDAWRDMPSVGFVPPREPPPRLWLPVEAKHPVNIDLVVNQSITGVENFNLIARLEVLSQMSVRDGSLELSVLDLGRQKIALSQKLEGPPDSRSVLAAMPFTDPRVLHADLFLKYKEGSQFFIDQIRQRLENHHIVIVLSAPWAFLQEESTPAIQNIAGSVFYIRCNSPGSIRYLRGEPTKGPSGARHGIGSELSDPATPEMTYVRPDNSDSLESTLKAIHPRLFDVTNASDFRRALGTILREIAAAE